MKVKDSAEIKRKEITKWPKVAIIILNWNGWKDTIECLESVFRNTSVKKQKEAVILH